MPELIENVKNFYETTKRQDLSVIHFSASWVEQCKQIDDVIDALSKEPELSNVKFMKCEAENLAEVSLQYQIEAAPTVILFRAGKVIGRVDGVDPAKLTGKIKQLNKPPPETHNDETSSGNFKERLKKLINKSKVMLFMKGDRDVPRCGFSRQIVEILNSKGVAYETFDILTDEEVRQGLKLYSDWPTYPQLYINGELIGGLDIIKELEAAGELLSTLNGE